MFIEGRHYSLAILGERNQATYLVTNWSILSEWTWEPYDLDEPRAYSLNELRAYSLNEPRGYWLDEPRAYNLDETRRILPGWTSEAYHLDKPPNHTGWINLISIPPGWTSEEYDLDKSQKHTDCMNLRSQLSGWAWATYILTVNEGQHAESPDDEYALDETTNTWVLLCQTSLTGNLRIRASRATARPSPSQRRESWRTEEPRKRITSSSWQ